MLSATSRLPHYLPAQQRNDAQPPKRLARYIQSRNPVRLSSFSSQLLVLGSVRHTSLPAPKSVHKARNSRPQEKVPTGRRNRMTSMLRTSFFFRCREPFENDASLGFSVMSTDCFDTETHTHEVAHNFGCGHTRNALEDYSPSHYNFGVRHCSDQAGDNR